MKNILAAIDKVLADLDRRCGNAFLEKNDIFPQLNEIRLNVLEIKVLLREKEDTAPELLGALKDAHPYIPNDIVRKRIGRLISKATGESA